MLKSTKAALLTLIVVASVLLPGAVAAGQPEPGEVNTLPPERGPAQFVIVGGRDADDFTVDLTDDAQTYIVTDRAGLVTGDGCTSTTAKSARCQRFGFDDIFHAQLGDGNDVFRFLTANRAGQIEGNAGADEIVGNASNNGIFGGGGTDHLQGGGGSDRLFGHQARDRLHGGRGPDQLNAVDGARDAVINCGSGDDRAVIDRNIDPAPVDCERIRRR